MEPLRTYRPLSRSLRMPSGLREQGLAVLLIGLAVAIGFGWGAAVDRLWALGKATAPGLYAGMVPDGPAGGFRFRGVYLFQDSAGTAFSVLTDRARPVRTRRDGAPDPRRGAAGTGIVGPQGGAIGEVVALPSGGAAPDGPRPEGVAGLMDFPTRPFPQRASIAYDPADPSVARVTGLEDRWWPGIAGGLAIALAGLWMRRRPSAASGEAGAGPPAPSAGPAPVDGR